MKIAEIRKIWHLSRVLAQKTIKHPPGRKKPRKTQNKAQKREKPVKTGNKRAKIDKISAKRYNKRAGWQGLRTNAAGNREGTPGEKPRS